MPLLHTWSLAIEEQYYAFFPILVVLLWPVGKKWLFKIILLIAILSFFYSNYLSEAGYVDANFYLIFSRAWELFFGSLIAFITLDEIPIERRLKEFLSWIGLSLILYSIFMFDEQTPFPSSYTLMPIVGTCLIIMFSSSYSYVGRLLSTRVMVFVGLISYSLYLWHQPIFAILRVKTIGEPDNFIFLIGIMVSIVMAFISWKFVETPFRNKALFNSSSIFKYSLTSIIVFLTIGFVGHFNNGFENRFSTALNLENLTYDKDKSVGYFADCHTEGLDYLKPDNACRYFNDNVTWAVLGDSHASVLAYSVAEKLENKDEGIIHLTFSGCAPALILDLKQMGCAEWTVEAADFIVNDKNIENVLLAYRHSEYLFGNQLNTFPNIPKEEFQLRLDNEYSGLNVEEARELYWKSFKELISKLLNAGKNVYVFYPVPELPVEIYKAVSPISIFDNKPMLDLEKSTSVKYFNDRNGYIINKLNSLPYDEKLKSIRPFDLICNEEYCSAMAEGKIIYRDDNHLNKFGADLIVKRLFPN